MHSFSLPATANEHPPEFGNARSARDWLAQLDRSQALGMQARLPGRINLLNRCRMPAGDRLRVIEDWRVIDDSVVHEGQALLAQAAERVGPPECATQPFGGYRKPRNILLSGHHGGRRVLQARSLERSFDLERARIEPMT